MATVNDKPDYQPVPVNTEATMYAAAIKSAALVILMTGWGIAANDPFVGKWKFNPAKSQTAGQWVKVEDLGSNKYRFDNGAVPETLVVDGKDQPVEFGGTLSIQKTGDATWKTVYKMDGRILSQATWNVSPDGKNLTIHTTGIRLDGSTFENEEVYTKTTGASGLAGTWEGKSEKQSSPSVFEIQPHENGLSIVHPATQNRLDMRFDGKEYIEQGPTAPKGISTFGKRPNSNTLQLTDKHDGKVIDTAEWSVSSDGNVLTLTIHNTGQKKAAVLVYDRK